MQIVRNMRDRREPVLGGELAETMAAAMHCVAREARTIERRLAQSDWVVGESISAADMVIYPDIRLLLRALAQPAASELAARFLPMDINYPALGRWLERIAALTPNVNV
jgi:glutathione S-transferase